MPENWRSSFPYTVGKLLMPLIQSPLQVTSILGGWEAQLAIIQGELGGFFVRSTDETFQFKHLNYRRDRDSFSLGFQTHNQAPFDTLTAAKSVTWRLNTYSGDWRVPARALSELDGTNFQPRRLSEMPAWVGDIGLVVICTRLESGILGSIGKTYRSGKNLTVCGRVAQTCLRCELSGLYGTRRFWQFR